MIPDWHRRRPTVRIVVAVDPIDGTLNKNKMLAGCAMLEDEADSTLIEVLVGQLLEPWQKNYQM